MSNKVKILLVMSGGMIDSITANGNSVEIIRLEKDSDTPARLETLHVDEGLTNEKFDKNIDNLWREKVEDELKYTDEVEVKPDGEVVINEFSGKVIGKVKTETDGSFYVTVQDLDGDCYDVDIKNISFD